MELSAITSPNISHTRLDFSATDQADLMVMSQLAAVMPDEGSIMGPTLALVQNTPVPTYRVRTPLHLPPQSEIDVSVTLISDNAASFVCRTEVVGNVECFLRPLLEHLQGNAYVAKLFIRSMDIGEARVVIDISRMSPVAQIIIDIVVTHDIHISRLRASDYQLGESMHVSLRDQPAPAPAYRPDFVPMHVPYPASSRVPSQDIAPFYDVTLRPDVCLGSATETELIDRLESVRESTYRSTYDNAYDGTYRSKQTVPPTHSVAESTKGSIAGSNTVTFSTRQAEAAKESASSSTVAAASSRHRTLDASELYGVKSVKKYIRVLPSDCLFGPATLSNPQTRVIRIRNIYSSDIRIDCVIASRSFTFTKQNVYHELAPGCRAFEIVSQSEYRIPGTPDPNRNYVEIAVRFAPAQSNSILHAAKLIINVAPDVSSDQHDNRAFQVPLLGIAGRPFLTVLGDEIACSNGLIKIGDQVSLRLKNDGLATAFVKTAAIVQSKTPDEQGYVPYITSEAYKIIPDVCVIAPGCSKDIFVVRTGVSNKAPSEEEVVEIRYGHEGLRLLGMAYEGSGPWADLIRQLQLREDPLRIMGQNVEKLTVRIKP